MYTMHTIKETHDVSNPPTVCTMSPDATVLVVKTLRRDDAGSIPSSHLRQYGEVVKTTMGEYVRGEVVGLTDEEHGRYPAFTLEDDEDAEIEMAVPFILC